MWQFEALLLRLYSRLVTAVRQLISAHLPLGRQRRKGAVGEVGLTAVKAMATMLARAYHFNCRKGQRPRAPQHTSPLP